MLFPFPSQQITRKYIPKQFKLVLFHKLFCKILSKYKNHNKWKFLGIISSSASFTFVSKLWTGRISDKKVTAEPDIL